MYYFSSTTFSGLPRPDRKYRHCSAACLLPSVTSPPLQRRWASFRNELHRPPKAPLLPCRPFTFPPTITPIRPRQPLLRTLMRRQTCRGRSWNSEYILSLIHI